VVPLEWVLASSFSELLAECLELGVEYDNVECDVHIVNIWKIQSWCAMFYCMEGKNVV
jgi:hypothetical protein